MENSLIYNLASVLKRLRARRGWSQLDLALKAGVDRRYMSDVENGKRNVSIDVLTRLSEAFGIPSPPSSAKRKERKPRRVPTPCPLHLWKPSAPGSWKGTAKIP